jgi:hypothetical protein
MREPAAYQRQRPMPSESLAELIALCCQLTEADPQHALNRRYDQVVLKTYHLRELYRAIIE